MAEKASGHRCLTKKLNNGPRIALLRRIPNIPEPRGGQADGLDLDRAAALRNVPGLYASFLRTTDPGQAARNPPVIVDINDDFRRDT